MNTFSSSYRLNIANSLAKAIFNIKPPKKEEKKTSWKNLKPPNPHHHQMVISRSEESIRMISHIGKCI